MTAPIPTPEVQVQQPAQEPAAPQAPEAAAPPAVPDEERILTVDETESLFRGFQPEADDATPDQGRMVADFVGQLPPPSGEAPAQPPAVLPQATLEQAVQQTAAQPPPQPVPAGQQAVAPAQVPQPATPEVAALQAEVALLRQTMAAMNQAASPAVAPAAPGVAPAPAPGQPPAPTYGFDVPPQYLAALASEDDGIRRQGLNSIMNGVAEAVTQQIRTEMDQRFQAVPQQVQPILDQRDRATQINRDMYGTYPELEPYREYVSAAAQRLQHLPQHQVWGPMYRDAIAEQLAPMVPGLAQKIQQIRATGVAAGPPLPLPQVQVPQAMPPGVVQPGGPVGGVHVPPAQQAQPMLVRDAAGNIFSAAAPTQPYVGSPQVRQNGGQGVDPQIADIWHTLNYT